MREGARRNGVLSGIKKWPNARIPYAISSEYNERERAVLARAFQEYHTRTCVRFSPRTAFDHDYLYIGKIDGCFSDVGRAGGRQELSLDHGCLQYDTAIHELMHSVGFFHEHERWDRDKYITILWHNIDEEAYDQFGKVDLSESSYYGQPYDYHSIMHYDSLAFSKNGLETLIAKRSEMTLVMGSAVDFSTIDLAKINQMYSCSMRTRSMFSQPDLIDAHLIAMDTRRSVASTQLLSESRRGWVALCKRSFGHQRQGEVEEGKGFDKEKVQKREKMSRPLKSVLALAESLSLNFFREGYAGILFAFVSLLYNGYLTNNSSHVHFAVNVCFRIAVTDTLYRLVAI
uniref:Metalloendopeptidase n=1 Tax=Ascaris lumbricoides TaxID=6252 RepID=A0A9J2P9C0_ASCLU